MNTPESDNVFHRILNGEGTANDSRRLCKLVRRNPALLDGMATLLMVERLIRHRYSGMASDAFAEKVVERLTVGETGDVGSAYVPKRLLDASDSARRGLRVWTRRLLPLAAVFLAAVGLFAWRKSVPVAPMYAIGRLTRAIGDAQVSEELLADGVVASIRTPSGSFCRFDLNDGTTLAVNELSALRWRTGPDAAATLTMEAGEAYLDVAPRKSNLRIAFEEVDIHASVLGTRLLTGYRDRIAYVGVFEGSVMMRRADAALRIAAGQTAVADSQSDSIMALLLPVQADKLHWTDHVGLDSARILARTPAPLDLALVRSATGVDFSHLVAHEGLWRAEGGGENLKIVYEKESADGRGRLTFGRQRFKEGEFSFRAVVSETDRNESALALGFVFFYPGQGQDYVMLRRQFARMLEIDHVLNLTIRFEVRPKDNALFVREMRVTPESRSSQSLVARDYVGSPSVSRIENRESCVVGIAASGCTVEFSDFRLVRAVPDDE